MNTEPSTKNFTFKKNERITSRLLMQQLFGGKGTRSLNVFPLRTVFCEVEHHGSDAQVQVLFSVSKRHFKHAVDRNRIKRQMREAYRLHKALLPEISEGRQLLIAFIWLTDRHMPSAKVSAALTKALVKIEKTINPEIEKCEE